MASNTVSEAAPATSDVSFFDLRRWLEKAKALGQLKKVDHAALDIEPGTITEINAKRKGPAILFDKFDGFPEGFRILTCSMGNATTVGLALGFEGKLGNVELVGKIAAALREVEGIAKDYPVQLVEDGPVMENRQIGDDVDLTVFPTPLWHEGDGGRFIGTGAVQLHRDPDTGWVNLAPYRVQLQGKNLLSNFIAPGHHGQGIRQKYWDRGQPCPVVMCLGIHPLIHLIGATDVPPQVDELTWIGALARQRVPVITGPVTGLPIPADAEVAIEGYAYPGEEMSEGPFGEFTGYYAGGERKQPLVQVKAVYYRNQPIVLGMPPSRPPDSVAYYFSVMRGAAIMETLRRAGIPGVKSVWSGEAGGGRMWLVTCIQQQYAGHAEAAAGIAALCQAGGLMCRYSIVVDEDVDPSDNDDVIWALCTRSDPASDIDILRQCWSTQLDPTIPRELKDANRTWNSRAIINACKRWDRMKSGEFPKVAESRPELIKAIKEKYAWLK
jgi:UbiD family decarboxylase